MTLPKNFEISSFLPPVIFKSPVSDKTYVCPGYHIVPNGTTLSEVLKHWIRKEPKDFKEEEKPSYEIHEKVNSSRGNGKQYDVTFNGNSWSCTCLGFGYRRKCRHIEKVKQKYIKSKIRQ